MVRARAVLFGVVRSRPNVRILACVQGLALAMVIGFGVSPARADNAPAGVPIISALGSPRSVNQAPSAGAVSEQFDIEVAPGRHDVRQRRPRMCRTMLRGARRPAWQPLSFRAGPGTAAG